MDNIGNYNLGFISDEDIYNHVKATVEKYRTSINLQEFNDNIVDPIKMTFDAKLYGKSMQDMIEQECIRQIDKTNTNNIGYFHQYLFKYAGNGWDVPKNGVNGFDVTNENKHIFCEVKNKHNTMNSSAASSNYLKMQHKILEDDKAVCYLVQIIAKKSTDEPWKITVDGKQYCHERIRKISIDQFYGIVFGDTRAFMRLCEALPHILDDILRNNPNALLSNSVFDELKQYNEDAIRSLYLLAFSTYEGFKDF